LVHALGSARTYTNILESIKTFVMHARYSLERNIHEWLGPDSLSTILSDMYHRSALGNALFQVTWNKNFQA
jgi:hypothetical protein